MPVNALNITSTKFSNTKFEDILDNIENDGTKAAGVKIEAFSKQDTNSSSGLINYLTISPSLVTQYNGFFIQASIDAIDTYAGGKAAFHFEHYIIISPKWVTDNYPTLFPAFPGFADYCDTSFFIKNETLTSTPFQSYLQTPSTDIFLSSNFISLFWYKSRPIKTLTKGLIYSI